MTKPCWSDSANSFSHSDRGITAPVGLPGEQTNSSCVVCQTLSGTLSQATAKLRAGSLGTYTGLAPASSAAPS
ncbi:hypothetical protein D3C86_1910070 [compost metagenome]